MHINLYNIFFLNHCLYRHQQQIQASGRVIQVQKAGIRRELPKIKSSVPDFCIIMALILNHILSGSKIRFLKLILTD